MKLKFLLVLLLGICGTISALKIAPRNAQNRVSVSLQLKIFMPRKWMNGVTQIYDGCVEVFKNFSGPVTEIGDTVMDSFKIYTDKLDALTNCNSTILSSYATEVVVAISTLSKLGESANNILYVFSEGIPHVTSVYRRIVSELSSLFGKLTQSLIAAITDVEKAFIGLIKQYQNWFTEKNSKRKCELGDEIDFSTIMKSAQRLINTIATIASTAINDCATTSNYTNEAAAVVTLILYHLILCVEGVNTIIGSEIYKVSHSISDFLNDCLLSLHPFVRGMTDTIASISYDVEKSVNVLLKSLVDFNCSLNERFVVLFKTCKC